MCRTGCPTQDHETLAQCYKDTSFHIAVGAGHERNVKWDRELSDYAHARKQGIQPASTKAASVASAVELSRAADAPYDAGTGLFKP